ncbi:YpzG family protein [Bacillus suaedae]|uniref:YpzG family protein n=1 Tax=Halalkalibacter suaedae TaxID=2822140 RepID=A0A940WXB6_9BACI|nr:YpzG family protein [Bacillus suaedae]MBP3952367.1 YpzG family protein [Bacillus suaedae]
MGKEKNTEFDYKSPFDSPRANPKHASHQIGGETQMSQHDIKFRINRRTQR